MHQETREALVIMAADAIAEAIEEIKSIKRIDGRSEQGRYTAIVLTEAEKFQAIAERLLQEGCNAI